MKLAVPITSRPPRFYTPWQIAVSTILGGPPAGGFLAMANHRAFGAPTKAVVTMVASVIVFIGEILAHLMMGPFANRSVGLLLIVIAYGCYAVGAFRVQISNHEAKGWIQHSWWRAIGISVAFLAAVLLILYILTIQVFD